MIARRAPYRHLPLRCKRVADEIIDAPPGPHGRYALASARLISRPDDAGARRQDVFKDDGRLVLYFQFRAAADEMMAMFIRADYQ